MKKVVKESSSVTPDQVKCTDYIGLQLSGCKGFVTSTHFESGRYVLRAARSVTIGNGWDGEYKSLKDAVEYILTLGGEVFVFDSDNELFRWLSL